MKKPRSQRYLRAVLWRGQLVVNWLRTKLIYARDARALNRELFAVAYGLDEQEVIKTRAKLREFGMARGHDQETQGLWESHVYRLMLTQKWIAEILDSMPGKIKALDLGVEGIASDYWHFKFPQVQWENTDYDLRFPWKAPASSLDLIICTELVEHLSDQPNEIFNEGFYKLGFIALLRESFKALKPGGYLFMTTPNAASILHLKAVLQGNPPWFFEKHVREYTLPEIIALLKQAGFEIVRQQDVHCMSVMTYPDYSPVFQLLLENGFPTAGRGDDLFVLAHKLG
jgi:SAM-dependent methyltransferase